MGSHEIEAVLRLMVSGANTDCSLIPKEISLDKDHTILGRSKHCDIIINPVHLDGTANTISRKHISIDRRKDGLYEFKDLGALNGTFLNDKKSVDGILMHGDTIQLGGGAGLADGETLVTREAGVCFTFFVLKATPTNCLQPKTRSNKKRELSPSNTSATTETILPLKKVKHHPIEVVDSLVSPPATLKNIKKEKVEGVSKMSSLTCKLEEKSRHPNKMSPSNTTSISSSAPIWRAKSPTRICLVNNKNNDLSVSSQTPEKSILRGEKNHINQDQSNSNRPKGSVRFGPGTKPSVESPHMKKQTKDECNKIPHKVSISCQTSIEAETLPTTSTSSTQTLILKNVSVETQTNESSVNKSLLSTVPTSTALVLMRELSCGICSLLLLDSRCLPCSHGFCHLCLVDYFTSSTAPSPRQSSPRGTLTTGGEVKKRKCPVCKYGVGEDFIPTKSMHLENMVDLVVDSLPTEEQDAFRTRRKDAKERLMVSIDLGEEGPSESCKRPADSEDQEGVQEIASQTQGTQGDRCENCAEVGHHFDDCPHRNSSEEEEEESEEEDELDSGEDY